MSEGLTSEGLTSEGLWKADERTLPAQQGKSRRPVSLSACVAPFLRLVWDTRPARRF